MKSKLEKEALIEWHLRQITQPLGFSIGEPLPYEVRANRVWWFYRKGERFKTEVISISLQWRTPAAITLECFASPMSETGLRSEGLRGATAIGSTPYVYLVHGSGRPQQDVMGEIIHLGPEEGWNGLFDRLGVELAAIEPGFWDDLWSAWQRRVGA